MTPDAEPVRDADVQRALDAVRATRAEGQGRAASALAFDVLSRQAEGRTFFAGEKYVAKRAEQHGVGREHAQTEAGNLVDVLERGAQEPIERALVAAFAVAGFGDALAEDGAEAKVFRFVRHLDWLEVSSTYRVTPFVEPLLGDDAARVWREIAQAVVDDAASRDGGTPAVRARNAARLSTLAAASAGGDALRDVIRSAALDEPTRLLASTLAGDGAGEVSAAGGRLEGFVGRAPRRSPVEVLRWVSGWALASWIVRAVGFLLGVRRAATVRIADDALEITTAVTLLGRTVRERRETWRLGALEDAGREVRYPAIHLLVGAACLSAGVLLGGLALFDGARSGELVLFLVAAVLVLGGAGLDLALDVLVPARRGRVVVDIGSRDRRLRVSRVRLEEAEAFLRALRAAARRA